MYLVIITVPNERDDRIKRVKTQAEAYEYVMKLKNHMLARDGLKIRAEVYALPEPVEIIT